MKGKATPKREAQRRLRRQEAREAEGERPEPAGALRGVLPAGQGPLEVSRRTAPILAVIPARGGSKAVRRKNLQLVGGVPLVLRTARIVTDSGQCARVVVSTDDDEIAGLCRLHDIEVIRRPDDLAGDAVPLGPVIAQAALACKWSGLVASFQPTCPRLSPLTIQRMVGWFRGRDEDWAITTTPSPHTVWHGGKAIQPRVNRQARTAGVPELESGAIALYTLEALSSGAGRGAGFVIGADEALDIDTWDDLAAARNERRAILMQIRVGKTVGTGHLHRAIRLAEGLGGDSVGVEIVGETPTWALSMLEERGLWWEGVHSSFQETDLDLVVLDQLDTTTAEVGKWMTEGVPVVTFEDEGRGAPHADLVVNELLPERFPGEQRRLHGPAFSILRTEFVCPPPFEVRDRVRRVLITFGGTDPAGLNRLVFNLLDQAINGERDSAHRMELRVMVGPGAEEVPPAAIMGGHMAEEMLAADLVITAQGRTMVEAAAIGVPAITIAANDRESRHVRCPGQVHLGVHAGATAADLLHAVQKLDVAAELRAEMSASERAAVDGRGLDRVLWRIEGLLRGLSGPF